MESRSRRRQRRAPEAARGRTSGARLPEGLAAAVTLLALGWAVAARIAPVLKLSFYNDDFVYLDGLRRRGLLQSLIHPSRVGGYLRPFSRELHFGLCNSLFGLNPQPYHIVNLALVLACTLLLWRIGLAWISSRGALLAAAIFGLWYSHAVLVGWASCSQDLWAAFFSLLAVLFFGGARGALSAAAFALALLSKESSAVVPGILLALGLATSAPREAARRVLPHVLILGGWGILYQIHQSAQSSLVWDFRAALMLPPRFLLSLAGLEGLRAWAGGAAQGVPWRASMPAFIACVALTRVPRGDGLKPASQAAFLAWVALGLLPLLPVAGNWSAYYFVLPLAGACLAIGAASEGWPGWVAAVVPLALLVSGQGTLQTKWNPSEAAVDPSVSSVSISRLVAGTWFQRATTPGLLEAVPHPEPRGLFLFEGLPRRNGFITGDGPAIRLLYGDTTLTAGYMSDLASLGAWDRQLYLFDLDGKSLKLSYIPLTSAVLHSLEAGRELTGQPGVAAALYRREIWRDRVAHIPRWGLGYALWEQGDTLGALAQWDTATALQGISPAAGRQRLSSILADAGGIDREARLIPVCVSVPRDTTTLLAAARGGSSWSQLMAALFYYRLSLFSTDPGALAEAREALERSGSPWAAKEVAAKLERSASRRRASGRGD